MTFELAMMKSCKHLGLDSHLKEIRYKKDMHSYAEMISGLYKKTPFFVKSSFMYLDAVDFCFYQDGENVNFSISGNISGNDKQNIRKAINKALDLCELCEINMKMG